MNLRTLVSLGTALAIGALPYAAFAADQKAPAATPAQPAAAAAATPASPADKGAPHTSTTPKKDHKKKKQTEPKS